MWRLYILELPHIQELCCIVSGQQKNLSSIWHVLNPAETWGIYSYSVAFQVCAFLVLSENTFLFTLFGSVVNLVAVLGCCGTEHLTSCIGDTLKEEDCMVFVLLRNDLWSVFWTRHRTTVLMDSETCCARNGGYENSVSRHIGGTNQGNINARRVLAQIGLWMMSNEARTLQAATVPFCWRVSSFTPHYIGEELALCYSIINSLSLENVCKCSKKSCGSGLKVGQVHSLGGILQKRSLIILSFVGKSLAQNGNLRSCKGIGFRECRLPPRNFNCALLQTLAGCDLTRMSARSRFLLSHWFRMHASVFYIRFHNVT